MIAALLAAATVAASVLPPDFKPPEQIRGPTTDELSAFYPMAARRDMRQGDVAMSCEVTVQGELEDCQVVMEDPVGVDFGWAALRVRTLFHFRPATSAGRPISWRMPVVIKFLPFPGLPPPTVTIAPFTLVNHPVWTAAPGFADLAAAYPKGAIAAVDIKLRCDVQASGALGRCVAADPASTGPGLAAAQALAPRFRMFVDPDALAQGKPLKVVVPFHFVSPASPEFSARRLSGLTWVAGLDSQSTQKLFPPAAAAKGINTGLGVAHCVVGADGALTDCAPGAATPDGLGFSEAAVGVAAVMRLSPWTQDGGPVDGAVINLPIRFNLAAKK